MDLSFYSMFVLEGCCFGIRGIVWRRNVLFRHLVNVYLGFGDFGRVLNRFHTAQKNHI